MSMPADGNTMTQLTKTVSFIVFVYLLFWMVFFIDMCLEFFRAHRERFQGSRNLLAAENAMVEAAFVMLPMCFCA